MPTDVAGLPLLPLIALIGGIIVLVKRDFLEYVVGLFLIGFGVLGILPALGVDLGVTAADLQAQIDALRGGEAAQ